MRALAIALAFLILSSSACRTTTLADVQTESPAARFERLKTRWDELENRQRPHTQEQTQASVADAAAIDAECERLYAAIAALAPEVPGALGFCIEESYHTSLGDPLPFRNQAKEIVRGLVRDHPDSEVTVAFLWRLWTGISYTDSLRDELLSAVSANFRAPVDSLARGWCRLAEVVARNGIGGPSPWNHDARLARRQLAEVEEDCAGTIVAMHAHDLARSLEIAERPEPAPAFEFVDSTDSPLDLEGARWRARLIVFWDPGRDDLDAVLKTAFEHWSGLGSGIPVLAVAVRAQPSAADAILPDYRSGIRQVRFADPMSQGLDAAGLSQLPASLLIDKEGSLCAVNLFGDALRRRFAQISGVAP